MITWLLWWQHYPKNASLIIRKKTLACVVRDVYALEECFNFFSATDKMMDHFPFPNVITIIKYVVGNIKTIISIINSIEYTRCLFFCVRCYRLCNEKHDSSCCPYRFGSSPTQAQHASLASSEKEYRIFPTTIWLKFDAVVSKLSYYHTIYHHHTRFRSHNSTQPHRIHITANHHV